MASDYLVSFDTNRYSVPFMLIGQAVEVQRRQEAVTIFHRGELVATYPRLTGRYQLSIHASAWTGRSGAFRTALAFEPGH